MNFKLSGKKSIISIVIGVIIAAIIWYLINPIPCNGDVCIDAGYLQWGLIGLTLLFVIVIYVIWSLIQKGDNK